MGIARPGAPASWEAGVAAILDDPGAVRIAFQPIADLSRAQATGCEALARFTCEPLAGPDVWLGRARALEVGARVEALLVSRALAARGGLPPNAFLTVNVSAVAIFSPEVRTAFADAVDLSGVIVEITEEAPVESYEGLREVLAPLRARGAKIAVDDAGSGYAGLQQLLCIRPELVKADRSLISGIDTDPAKRALVRMLGAFLGELDAWLLAEGIETDGELEALIDLGVPLGQGYRLGRPAGGFTGVDPSAADLIRDRSHRIGSQALLSLADPAPASRWGAGSARPQGERAYVVSVDEGRRPMALHHRDDVDDDMGPAVRRMLLVQLEDEPSALVLRAVVREEADRLAPLVLCDYEGRYVGLLPMDRLAERLAHGSLEGAPR